MYDKKKKILHFTSSISKSSGVMSVIMNYYSHLDREKFQFDFVCFKKVDEDYTDEIEKLGGIIHYISSPTNFFNFKKEINYLIEKNKYEILHNHEVYLSVFLKRIISPQIMLITHSHNTKLSDKKFSNIRNTLLCKNINHYSDFNIACSKKAGESLFGAENFKVIYNAVDPGKFQFNLEKRKTMRKKLGIENEKIIGNIGRYSNQKNQLFLIDIFMELIKIRSNVKMLIIGEGPLEKDIKDKIKENGLEKKIFVLPFQNNISDYFQMFDLFVLPSLYEGLPVVGVEAQYSGLNCVFSDEITHEIGFQSSEFISLKTAPGDWALKIERLLNEKVDRVNGSTNEMNEKGFNIHYSVKDLEKIYLGL